MTKEARSKKQKKQIKRDLALVLMSLEEDIDKLMAAANRLYRSAHV